MRTFFFFVVYNFMFIPVFFVVSHLAALFNLKLRRGIFGRYRIYRDLRKHRNILKSHPVAVVHCASMGEFEHIKPFLKKLNETRPEFKIVVLFFSPSGYQNVNSFPGVEFFVYSPFDWFLPVFRFMKFIKPDLWIVAKHDVWPNQLWLAHFLSIPVFLINASLHGQSSRLLFFTRTFHRSIYQYFTKILAISEADRKNFLRLVTEEKVIVAGDTKYDQVLYRRKESNKKTVVDEKIISGKWVFVAGSTWPEDQKYLIPAIRQIIAKYREVLVIICPHEPTPEHLEEISAETENGISIKLSRISHFRNERIIVVDKIGVLANLYHLAKVAYVGGSFRQGIHNVLEPAVYGIPVLFGPVNRNSHEAQILKAENAAIEINTKEEIFGALEKFLHNDIYRQECGNRARQVVEKNCGATDRTIRTILSFLPEEAS